MKKKPKNPVLLLRVEVTPELRAALKWHYPVTARSGLKPVLYKILATEVDVFLTRHRRAHATGADTPLDDLELSVRAANFLQSQGMQTAGEVAARSGEEWYRRGMALKVVAELRAVLGTVGLSLKGNQ